MVHPLQSPQGSRAASTPTVPGQIKPLSTLFGQISVLHKPRACWCLSKAFPVAFKRQNMTSRAHRVGRCLQYSSVTRLEGPIANATRQFTIWRHEHMVSSEGWGWLSEDQQGHVSQKSDGTGKDAGTGVRKTSIWVNPKERDAGWPLDVCRGTTTGR